MTIALAPVTNAFLLRRFIKVYGSSTLELILFLYAKHIETLLQSLISLMNLMAEVYFNG